MRPYRAARGLWRASQCPGTTPDKGESRDTSWGPIPAPSDRAGDRQPGRLRARGRRLWRGRRRRHRHHAGHASSPTRRRRAARRRLRKPRPRRRRPPTRRRQTPTPGGKLVMGIEADTSSPWMPAEMLCAISCHQVIKSVFDPMVVPNRGRRLVALPAREPHAERRLHGVDDEGPPERHLPRRHAARRRGAGRQHQPLQERVPDRRLLLERRRPQSPTRPTRWPST